MGNRTSALPIDGGGRNEIINKLNGFTQKRYGRIAQPILVISYETFRSYADILQKGDIGLVLCDEVSDIKNTFNLRIKKGVINKNIYVIGSSTEKL